MNNLVIGLSLKVVTAGFVYWAVIYAVIALSVVLAVALIIINLIEKSRRRANARPSRFFPSESDKTASEQVPDEKGTNTNNINKK